MDLIAPHAGRTPGIYQVITSANLDYPIAIPKYANGIMFWFEQSTSITTLVGGRFAVNGSATQIGSILNDDNKLAYVPGVVIQFDLAFDQQGGAGGTKTKVTHAHFASAVAGAVLRGAWLCTR